MTELRLRLAGRVIVLDPDDRVLPFRYDDPPPGLADLIRGARGKPGPPD
jgi:hypothetical protein